MKILEEVGYVLTSKIELFANTWNADSEWAAIWCVCAAINNTIKLLFGLSTKILKKNKYYCCDTNNNDEIKKATDKQSLYGEVSQVAQEDKWFEKLSKVSSNRQTKLIQCGCSTVEGNSETVKFLVQCFVCLENYTIPNSKFMRE